LYYAREYEGALDKLRQALELDPGLVPAHRVSRWVYQTIGRYEEALAAYQNEKSFSGGTIYASQNQTAAYKNEMSFSGAADGEWPIPLAQVQAGGGRLAEAQGSIKRGVNSQYVKRHSDVMSYQIAVAYALMGKRDEALLWLAKTEAARTSDFAFAFVDPDLDNLRSDPRFVELMKKARLQK